jgi:hypothetical protein
LGKYLDFFCVNKPIIFLNATINFHGMVNVLGMFDVLPHVPNVIFGALDILWVVAPIILPSIRHHL